jgi:hypothetical protein
MKKMVSICLLILCSIPMVAIVLYAADSVPVSCYVGDPDDDEYMGDIEAFNTSGAPALCNNFFSECQGNCTGCYIDEESEEFCIDSGGRRFTR